MKRLIVFSSIIILLATGCNAQKDIPLYKLALEKLSQDSTKFFIEDGKSNRLEFNRLKLDEIKIFFEVDGGFKLNSSWKSFLANLDTNSAMSKKLKLDPDFIFHYDSLEVNRGKQNKLSLSPIVFSDDQKMAFMLSTITTTHNTGSYMWFFENSAGKWSVAYYQMYQWGDFNQIISPN